MPLLEERRRNRFAHVPIPQDAGPANQLHGGHGFTGIYMPTTWCLAPHSNNWCEAE